MSFPRVSLTLTGLLFLSLGIAFLAAPDAMVRIFRLTTDRPATTVEIQAMFGGLQTGLGLFFLVSSFRFRWARAALGAQILVFAGLAGGRLLALILAPVRNRIHILYFVVECVGALIGLIGFRRVKTLLLNSRTPSL